jgi:hypothetical protein
MLLTQSIAHAAGHGPVFALATPTSPQGGFSLDLSVRGRSGDLGVVPMLRGTLGYGITENLKVSVSAPVLLKTDYLSPARGSAFSPMNSGYEGLVTWRFIRQDTGVGARIESTLIGGLVVPGGHERVRMPLRPGAVAGIVTGWVSRSHYIWGGVSYQGYATSETDRRSNILSYSAAYAFRPEAWRRDQGWDWRVFGEMVGERIGAMKRDQFVVPRSQGNQIFAGPSALGVYKNYAVSAGLQFPVHRTTPSFYPKESIRFAVNLAYFF